MQISKVAVSIVAALAVTTGGVVAATAQPSESREWTVIGLTDTDATDGITVTNPTNEELFCSLTLGAKQYIDPIFVPWNKPGVSYGGADRLSSVAGEDFSRMTSQKTIKKWNLSQQHYFGSGETRNFTWLDGFPDASPVPNEGIVLECHPEHGYKTVLIGYGTVQNDLSVKSDHLPTVAAPTPKPDAKETVTVSVPTTVWNTTTVSAPAPVPATKTITATTTAQEPKPVTTTVRETTTVTVTEKAKNSTADTTTPSTKEPTAVTSTVTATVTKTVPTTDTPEAPQNPVPVTPKEQNIDELIGWIIGIFVALGIGGALGFAANNLPLLHV